MARSPALAGSLAVHGVIAVLIVLLLSHEPTDERTGMPPGGVTVEVVNAAPLRSATAGGSPQPLATAPARAPRQARTTAPRTPGAPAFAVETTTRIEDPNGASGGAESSGIGDGGDGGGPGSGIGLGDGNGIANPADIASLPLPLPPRIKLSMARPPRLIWPRKHGDIVESELYIARLTIDADGLVDAVRLVRRFREPRDDQAEDAVWKFRYDPALDEDGRPTRATIEQPFLLRVH